MRPHDIHEDYVKMKTFPFSLDGVAKDWLYFQLDTINTWTHMKRIFLKKFYPYIQNNIHPKRNMWYKETTWRDII